MTANAVKLGLPLVNLVRSKEGATLLIDRFPSIPTIATSDRDWEHQLAAALGGRPSVVVDAVGGEGAGILLDTMMDGGTYIVYGALGGPSMTFDAATVIGRGLKLHGVTIGRWLAHRTAEERAVDVAQAMSLVSETPELFEVAAIHTMSDFLAAVDHAQRPGKIGTVLLGSRNMQ